MSKVHTQWCILVAYIHRCFLRAHIQWFILGVIIQLYILGARIRNSIRGAYYFNDLTLVLNPWASYSKICPWSISHIRIWKYSGKRWSLENSSNERLATRVHSPRVDKPTKQNVQVGYDILYEGSSTRYHIQSEPDNSMTYIITSTTIHKSKCVCVYTYSYIHSWALGRYGITVASAKQQSTSSWHVIEPRIKPPWNIWLEESSNM